MNSFDSELSYYVKYKRIVDKDIDARKEFYACRDNVSRNFDFSRFYDSVTNEYLGSEDGDFDFLNEGFEECGIEFSKNLEEINLEYEYVWENIFKERQKKVLSFYELKKEMELE